MNECFNKARLAGGNFHGVAVHKQACFCFFSVISLAEVTSAMTSEKQNTPVPSPWEGPLRAEKQQ